MWQTVGVAKMLLLTSSPHPLVMPNLAPDSRLQLPHCNRFVCDYLGLLGEPQPSLNNVSGFPTH